MGLAKARFKIVGEKASLRDVAVVDTGSLMSIVDEEIASTLGLKPTGRTLRLTTLSGEEVLCEEMLSMSFEIEDERLAYERVAVCKLSEKVKERLKAMRVSPHVIIGVMTLEAAGFVVNPLTGKIEKVGWLALSTFSSNSSVKQP